MAQALGDRDDRPSFRPNLEQPPAAGSRVPDGLLLAQTLEAIEHSSNLGGCLITPTSMGKLRTLASVGVGERLTAVATIRYRSVIPDGGVFLTLSVEIRGSRKLAEVEVGVEVTRRPALIPSPKLTASVLQAA